MESNMRNCLVVCGPTASGKTALGVRIALEVDGEILSADCRQVYRGLDIGSGKDLDEYTTPRGSVPYHLIDITEPEEIYSLYHYQRDFYRVYEDVTARGRLPVVVGGTGLYIEAALRKFQVPDVPADEAFRAEKMRQNLDELVAELKTRSPELARRTVLDCKRRVVRALEVARHTGRRGQPAVNETDADFKPLVFLVTWPVEELHDRIRRRLLDRLDAGLEDEVRRLMRLGLPHKRYALFGMEYRHVARYLRAEVSYQQMVEELLADIRYLARRQRTYFRGIQKRGMEVHEIPGAEFEFASEVLKKYRLVPGG